MRLTLGAPITQADSPTAVHDVIVAYSVLGLALDQSAQIHDFGADQGWRIRRVKDGVAGDWQGSYDSAEDAMAALQAQVDAGRWPSG